MQHKDKAKIQFGRSIVETNMNSQRISEIDATLNIRDWQKLRLVLAGFIETFAIASLPVTPDTEDRQMNTEYSVECDSGGNYMACEVPVWEKKLLTVNEAAAVFNIGINKIKQLSDREDCKFVLWVGNKRLIKTDKFEEYLQGAYSI